MSLNVAQKLDTGTTPSQLWEKDFNFEKHCDRDDADAFPYQHFKGYESPILEANTRGSFAKSSWNSIICYTYPERMAQLNEVIEEIRKSYNQKLSEQAISFLSTLKNDLLFIINQGIDVRSLGYFHLSEDEESVSIEWIFPDYRFGFCFEDDTEKSGWYLVSNENLGYMKINGYFNKTDTNLLINIINFFLLYEYYQR